MKFMAWTFAGWLALVALAAAAYVYRALVLWPPSTDLYANSVGFQLFGFALVWMPWLVGTLFVASLGAMALVQVWRRAPRSRADWKAALARVPQKSRADLAADLRRLLALQVSDGLSAWVDQALEVQARIQSSRELDGLPEAVWHYLIDADIRFKDAGYRLQQEKQLHDVLLELEAKETPST